MTEVNDRRWIVWWRERPGSEVRLTPVQEVADLGVLIAVGVLGRKLAEGAYEAGMRRVDRSSPSPAAPD